MFEFLEFCVPWISNKHTIMTVLSFLKKAGHTGLQTNDRKSLNYQLNSINSSWTIQYQKFTTKLKKCITMVLFSQCKKKQTPSKSQYEEGPKALTWPLNNHPRKAEQRWGVVCPQLLLSLASATVQCPVGKLENVQDFESRFQPWICGVGPRLAWNWISGAWILTPPKSLIRRVVSLFF